MEKKNTVIAAVVVVVIIIVAIAAYFVINNNGDDGGEETTGDTYYFYLDGMDDLNGWYEGAGDNAGDAINAALDAAGVEHSISGGWIRSIGDYESGIDGNYFGTYLYTSTSLDNPYAGYFVQGPGLEDINSNIVYVTYTTYTYDEEYGLIVYELNPLTTTGDLMSTGPFASSDYEPLEYSQTYYFYLDGMGDISGWYTGTGSNADEAIQDALDDAGVEYSISGGWISSIGDCESGVDDYYFGTFTYTSSSTESPYGGYFQNGPTLGDVTGNIIYVTYSGYVYLEEYGTMYYLLNPATSESDVMSTGPFA